MMKNHTSEFLLKGLVLFSIFFCLSSFANNKFDTEKLKAEAAKAADQTNQQVKLTVSQIKEICKSEGKQGKDLLECIQKRKK